MMRINKRSYLKEFGKNVGNRNCIIRRKLEQKEKLLLPLKYISRIAIRMVSYKRFKIFIPRWSLVSTLNI